MHSKLTCSQVSALLSDYIEDKLSDNLKQFISVHLESCPTCRAKYDALKDMMGSLKEIKNRLSEISAENYYSKQDKKDWDMTLNLSAYVDNELSDEENLRVKKCIISNPEVREKLERINNLRKVMNEAFEKTKNEDKIDFARQVLSKTEFDENIYNDNSFARVVAIFVLILAVCTISAVLIFTV
ncbi:zf-HC2 domain-containing protein [bacterium]|nr:zf-HC2 domain-containing protein [bacterium]